MLALALVLTLSGADGGQLVIHAARAINPSTGAVVSPAWLTIDQGRIVSLSSTAPDAGPTLELPASTLTPAFVDAHAHLLSVQSLDEHSIALEAVTLSEADRALRGSHFARQMLEAGFTTVRDLGNAGTGADVSLARALREGWVSGPRLLVSTRALAPPGAQFPRLPPSHAQLVQQEYAIVRSPAEGRAAVLDAIAAGADCIKVIVDQGPFILDGDTLKAIVEEAHLHELKVAAHALRDRFIARAVEAGVDSIEHGYQASEATLASMAQRKVALVPTDYLLEHYLQFEPDPAKRPRLEAQLRGFRKQSLERLRRAKALGVTLVAGSDAYDVSASDRGVEALNIVPAYAESGLSGLEILRMLTVNGAALLRLEPLSHTLTPGASADLVVLEGDPLKDPLALTRVKAVFQGGRRVR